MASQFLQQRAAEQREKRVSSQFLQHRAAEQRKKREEAYGESRAEPNNTGAVETAGPLQANAQQQRNLREYRQYIQDQAAKRTAEEAARTAPNQSPLDRIKNLLSGAVKESAASMVNTTGTAYQLTQKMRDKNLSDTLNDYAYTLERARQDMETMEREQAASPGTYSQAELDGQRYILEDAQRKFDAMTRAGKIQTAEPVYQLADDLQISANADTETAKNGLGAFGRLMVDAGTAATQSAADAAVSLLTGTGMLPFAARAFGGAAGEARRDGADETGQVLYGAANAAKEIFTEKMFNIALPFSKAYGGGALDDTVKRGIRNAVQRFAKTGSGKHVLGSALTLGASAVSEGAEEFIGDWMEWQLPRIYGGNVDSAGEMLENSLYDFLVGASAGAMGGVMTPGTYHYRADETNQAPTEAADAAAQTRTAARTVPPAAHGTVPAYEDAARGTVPADVARRAARAAFTNSMVRNGRSFGESGKAAFTAINDSSVEDQEAFFRGFVDFYNAGAAGKRFGDIRSVYAGTLDEVQRREAFFAGQNDAAAKLAAQRTAVQAAAFQGKEAGLAENEWSARMDGDERRVLDTMAKDLGVKAVIDGAVSMGGQENAANGYLKDGVIHIASDSSDAVSAVRRHEVTHRLQELAPDEYTRFRNYALSFQADVQKAVEDKQAAVSAASRGTVILSNEEAMDELAADFAGQLLSDEQTVRRIWNDDRSLAQKLRDIIVDLARRVKEALGRAEPSLERAAKLWDDAYRAAMGQAETLAGRENAASGQGDGTVRMSVSSVESPYRGRSMTEDGEIYSYPFLTSLKDARVVSLPDVPTVRDESGRVDDKTVIAAGLQNARDVGMERDGKIYVKNEYTGRELRIDISSIRHGLNGGMNRLLTNARLGAVIGDVVKNAVPINALQNKAKGVSGTYAMAAYAEDSSGREFVSIVTIEQRDSSVSGLEVYDVTHAISGRQKNRSERADTKSQGVYPSTNASDTISIADLLRVVKETYQSILSVDVLEKLGEKRNPTGYYSGRARYSIKNTEMDSKRNDDLISQDGEESTARFSPKKKTLHSLERENTRLKGMVEYLRGQMKRSTGVTTDSRDVVKTARALLREYESQYDFTELTGRLQKFYDWMASGVDENGNELSWGPLRDTAKKIAREIVEWSWSRDDELYRGYQELRAYLRTQKIHVPKEMWGELDQFGGYNEFRKSYFGRLNLSSNDGAGVDQVFQELSSLWPEFFDEQKTVAVGDQLARMAEVLDLIRPHEYNKFESELDDATNRLAADIIDRFYDMRQVKTFADKQAEKMVRQRLQDDRRFEMRLEREREKRQERIQELREAAREMVRKEREKRAEAIEKVKNKYDAKIEGNRERQQARELRGRIVRHVRRMSSRLLHPTDKQNIPENLRGPVAAVLQAINLTSGRDVGKTDGEAVTTRTQAFLELKAEYARIVEQNEGDMVIDPALLGDGDQSLLDDVIAMEQTPLDKLSSVQLEKVWQCLKAIESSINSAGKILSAAKFKRISDWAGRFLDETSTRRDKSAILSEQVLDLIDPYTFFSSYGESGNAVYRMLRDAQDSAAVKTRDLAAKVQKIVDTATIREIQRQRHTFTTQGGEKITLTTGQLMDLWNLSRREQAVEHLLQGGIVQPEIPKTGQQKKIERGTRMIRVTVQDLRDMIGHLSQEQKSIADQLQALTASDLAAWGNEASMAAYGYRKFTEDHYWPIRSAREVVHSSVEKDGQNARSIKNIGMAQALRPHAKNAVELGDVFDVFAAHAADMIDYASWLLPMEDAARLFNYQYRDGMGELTGRTFKGELERVGGKGSQTYWKQLMSDIQNPSLSRGGGFDRVINRVVGNVKGAAVGANLRVVIQQPTAWFRAAVVLDPRSMAQGLRAGATEGNGWEKAKKWAAIAQIKDVGGFDQGSARSIAEQLYGTRTGLERFNEVFSAPAGLADAVTWGRLWNASEWETTRLYPGIERGSDAFYHKTAAIFTDMVDQTQVVDGVLQRAQMMRSDNALHRQASSFMGEPLKSLNILIRSWDHLRYEQDPARRAAAIKRMGRAATALLVTDIVNAIAQSLIDAERDDDPDKKYWARFRAAFTGLTGEEETLWEKAAAAVLNGNAAGNVNPLGRIPYAKDALSLVQGFHVQRMDADAMQDVIDSSIMVNKSLSGDGPRTVPYALKQLFAASARLFGVSVPNLTRDVWGFVRSAAVETDNIPLQYQMEQAIYAITNKKNRKRYMDILFRARQLGDDESFQVISRELMEQMPDVDEDSIRDAMRERDKKLPAFTQSSGELLAGQEALLKQACAGMDETYQETAEKWLSRYAAARTLADMRPEYEEAYQKEYAKLETAGVEPWKYALFRAALAMEDDTNRNPKKRNNSYDADEISRALQEIKDSLTREERRKLERLQKGK